jgi:hypothetical protein
LPYRSSCAAPTQNFSIHRPFNTKFQKSPYCSMYMIESRQSGASSVDAGILVGLGSSPTELASQTSSGACVSLASMNAATGMNDAIPLQA